MWSVQISSTLRLLRRPGHVGLLLYIDVPFEWIVVRGTSEPIVVNLPDDFWNDINLSPTHSALTTNNTKSI
jgi:hypothetical protein